MGLQTGTQQQVAKLERPDQSCTVATLTKVAGAVGARVLVEIEPKVEATALRVKGARGTMGCMNGRENGAADSREISQLAFAAYEEFARYGAVTTVRCDVCHGLIEVERINESAHRSSCSCGRFNGSVRGL